MTTTSITALDWETIQAKLGLEPVSSKRKQSKAPSHSAPFTQPRSGQSIDRLLAKRCADGERTTHLVTLIGKLLATGYEPANALALCHHWNANNIEPLDEEKIEKTFASILARDQSHHPERYAQPSSTEPFFQLSAGRIDRYLSEQPPPRRWLLKDLVVLGKAAAVIAPGGSSKSQWLLQLAVGVATGLPVADHWEVGETGSVIVFFAEDDEDEIHRRIKRIQEQLTIKGQRQKLSGLAERLYVFSTIGKTMLLTRSDAAGEVVTTHIVNSVVDLAKQLPDLRLIVIDPASRFRGGEENSNEDATRFVEALETLAKATGASVMLAHHTNKGSYTTDGDPGQGASRGASALTDGLRWQMNLNRLSDRQAKEIGIDKALLARYVAATVTKTNYSAIPEPVILERLPGGYLSVVSATQAKNRAENDAMARVLWVVERVGPLSARDLEDLYGGLKQSLKMAKQNVRAVVKLAVERGLLAGGDRQPITITTQGTEMLRYRLDMDLATCVLRSPPRRKTV